MRFQVCIYCSLCVCVCVWRYVFRGAERVGLQELGPRLTLKLRSLQRGTFDSKHGEFLWLHKVSPTSHFPPIGPKLLGVILLFQRKQMDTSRRKFHL